MGGMTWLKTEEHGMVCQDGLESLVEQQQSRGPPNSNRAGYYPCRCGRSFRRKGDLTRHQHFCNTEGVADSLHSFLDISSRALRAQRIRYHRKMDGFKVQGVCVCVCVTSIKHKNTHRRNEEKHNHEVASSDINVSCVCMNNVKIIIILNCF